MKEISQAIIAVMNDVNGVSKNTTVWTGNNSYKGVSDKDVRQAMRESMTKNGLCILPTLVQPTVKMDRWEEVDSYSKTPGAMKTKQSVFTEVVTKYLLIHTSWESVELGGYGQGVDTQDKGAGKATTYALKNTLLNMFLVPTGVDTDDTHSDELPVPKTNSAKKYYDQEEVNWYKDVKKNIDTWSDMIADGKTTPSEIIAKIEAQGYKLSNANKYEINAL